VESLAERLHQLGAAADTSDAVRGPALHALAALGPASRPLLEALCKADQPFPVRAFAIGAFASLDIKAAAALAVALLTEANAGTDPAPVVVDLLDRKGGAAALAEALNGKKLPADAAKLAVRAVRSAAREEPALVAALNAAGGLAGQSPMLSVEERSQLVADVASQGDAQRGEAIFRRAEQTCLKCHAIAGAGGRVGPDLVSIGASAPVDYLIDSILQPSAKIKENYHSLTVVVDGRVTSGVKVRETDQELVLRDVEDREISLPAHAIEEKVEGGSLMPVGLADNLTRAELVDLVRFLSELGKVGPYAVSNARVARRWQVWQFAAGDPRQPFDIHSPEADRADRWHSVYSQVSGNLPLDSLPPTHTGEVAGPYVVRCAVDVAQPGKVGLIVSGPVTQSWLDRAELPRADSQQIELAAGTHTITLLLGGASRGDVRFELVDVPGSPAQAQLVGGK
jgi:putative heme-binding domain-containing protein